MVMSMWSYLRYSAKPELDQPLENTLQRGLESSNKEDNTVSRGQLLGIVRASVETQEPRS